MHIKSKDAIFKVIKWQVSSSGGFVFNSTQLWVRGISIDFLNSIYFEAFELNQLSVVQISEKGKFPLKQTWW